MSSIYSLFQDADSIAISAFPAAPNLVDMKTGFKERIAETLRRYKELERNTRENGGVWPLPPSFYQR